MPEDMRVPSARSRSSNPKLLHPAAQGAVDFSPKRTAAPLGPSMRQFVSVRGLENMRRTQIRCQLAATW